MSTQDTSSQYLIVRALSDKFQNICGRRWCAKYLRLRISTTSWIFRRIKGLKTFRLEQITDRQKHRGSGQYYYR
jgi:hypothetical protein